MGAAARSVAAAPSSTQRPQNIFIYSLLQQCSLFAQHAWSDIFPAKTAL
jgi:hypothetical protein